MDTFFTLVESVFKYLQNMGVEKLTSVYLFIQLSFFVVLLLSYLIPRWKELTTLKYIKKQLIAMQEEQPSNLNKAIDVNFENVSKHSRYKKQWSKYYTRITKKESDEKIKIEPFFGLDAMHEALDKRGILDIGGGTHVSLGVLGTFIGLSVGLAELNMINPDALRTGVTGLIGGMKVAFYTSVLGVSLSILWTFIDRFLAGRIDRIIDWHSNEMSYLLNVDDEEIFLNRLEKITQEQSNQMKTIFSDALEHVMQPFVQSVELGNQQMTRSLAQVSSQMEKQSDISEEHLKYLKDQGQDVSSKLVDEISKGTNETIEQFVMMMESSKTAQSEMFGGMTEIAKQLESNVVSQQVMFDNTERLVSMFNTLSEEMGQTQTKYTSSFQHLDGLSEDLRQMQVLQKDSVPLQQSIIDKNEKFMERSDQLVNSLIQLAESQDRVQRETLDELIEKTNVVSERFEQLASNVQQAATEQNTAALQSKEFVEKMGSNLVAIQGITTPIERAFQSLGQLTEELNTMQTLQAHLIPQLSEWSEVTVSQTNQFQSFTKEQLTLMSSQLEETKNQWSAASVDFEKTREGLGSALKEFSGNIETSVTNTFQLFDKELVTVVEHFKLLSQEYETSQEEFTDAVEVLISKMDVLKQGARA